MPEIADPVAREAISAIDAGDIGALGRILATNPELLRERIENGETGYFARPYLLWFVAGNPVREERLAPNIVDVTRFIIEAARLEGVENLKEQLDYAIALVASGRVPRESGVQLALIDALADAGGDPESGMHPALAHRELQAVEQLLARGAKLTLTAAIGTGRTDDIPRLAPNADDRQYALAAAAFYGDPRSLELLLDLGVDVNAFAPEGFHAHATPLHHAVDSKSLEAVKLLVEAGAKLDTKDGVYGGTPLGWAEYLGRPEIAAYLRTRAVSSQWP
jgi:peptide-methionine (S)-S-oxide reductase